MQTWTCHQSCSSSCKSLWQLRRVPFRHLLGHPSTTRQQQHVLACKARVGCWVQPARASLLLTHLQTTLRASSKTTGMWATALNSGLRGVPLRRGSSALSSSPSRQRCSAPTTSRCALYASVIRLVSLLPLIEFTKVIISLSELSPHLACHHLPLHLSPVCCGGDRAECATTNSAKHIEGSTS